MNWVNKKVLVTGAAGFIGSHLVEQLLSMGAEVYAFVKYNSRNDYGAIEDISKESRHKLKIIMGDIREIESVRKAVKGREIIFHLAASIAIPYSYLNPKDVIETNILGTTNILNAALDYKVSKIIHTSTSEVYGSAQEVPINELHPLQAQSPYSASKIAADKIAESFYLSFDLPITIIRPFNTYGPRQFARAIIPTIISQALINNTIKLGALYPTRDFTFVTDTVNAFIKIAQVENVTGEVINIGSGKEISINELVKKIINLIGKDINDVNIEYEAERVRPRKSEVERLIADIQKAKNLIDWAPTISLNEGLRITINWVEKNLHKFKPKVYNI